VNRHILWTCVISVLVVAALGGASLLARPQRPTNQVGGREVAELRAQLERLERAVAADRTHRTAIAPPARAEPSPTAQAVTSATSHEAATTPAELAAAAERRRSENARRQAERRERLDFELEQEPRDAHWAREATGTVEKWLSAPDLDQYTLEQLDCRSTFCRAQLELPAGQDVSDFLTKIADKMGPFATSSLHAVAGKNGKRELVAYFGRAGEPLPR
jgi:hypothetical protein